MQKLRRGLRKSKIFSDGGNYFREHLTFTYLKNGTVRKHGGAAVAAKAGVIVTGNKGLPIRQGSPNQIIAFIACIAYNVSMLSHEPDMTTLTVRPLRAARTRSRSFSAVSTLRTVN